MKYLALTIAIITATVLAGCQPESVTSAQSDDAAAVDRQQSQYAKAQPIPAFDYSLERDLLIQLYETRNQEVTTHSVWRGMTSVIEGDCPSMGYGLPYDTSLTNPQVAVWNWRNSQGAFGGTTIGQPEPNGVFASTNTAATWVFCVGPAGSLEPVYVESTVTVYPGPVDVDYATNRVTRRGDATVTIKGAR